MKRVLRNSVVIAATFMLASCTPPEIEIAVSRVGGHLIISLTQDWGLIFSRKETPCIGLITLYEGNFAADRSAWRVEAKDEQCVDLRGFTLGQVPSGFVSVVPLAPGHTVHSALLSRVSVLARRR